MDASASPSMVRQGETLLVRRERTDARFEPIADDERLVENEERRQLQLVGLELLERCSGGRVLARRVLQLDDGDQQAIQEHDDVGGVGCGRPR
ncbi:MAG: hypothetical protein U0168_21170 [Nannocystaceae bacterium]